MEVNISPISEAHICGLNESVGIVARERKFLAVEDAYPIDETRKFVLNNISNGHPQFVALRNEAVVGWCDIIPGNPSSLQAHQGVLGIGLLPEFRHRGIGARLLETTLKAAFDRGLTRIQLTAWESNINAIALYRKFGFIVEGLLRGAICLDGRYSNLLSMALLSEAHERSDSLQAPSANVFSEK